jgi:hypothetical protein
MDAVRMPATGAKTGAKIGISGKTVGGAGGAAIKPISFCLYIKQNRSCK